MKRLFLTFSALCFLLLTCALAAAQTAAPPSPPPVLLITREDIKPGKMDAHAEEALANVRVMAKTNSMITNKDLRNYRIGMTPFAGNQNEVTYLVAYSSFANMEDRNKEVEKFSTGAMKADYAALPDKELHAAQANVLAVFRPELSYGVGNTDIAQARYVVMTTLRLKPGHEDEYWDAVKRYVNPARDKTPLKTSASYAVYQAVGGMPGPTFITFRPLKSLADLDTASSRLVRPAMSEEDRKKADEITDRTVVGSTTVYYFLNPRLSLVSPEFAARDHAATAFWITNPAPATTTTASTGGPQPPK
jgi:hypothetical protein